jgi:two-component system nitrate/nitrite response regulator NarL
MREGARPKIGVFIVSDVRFYRDGLGEVLNATDEVAVLGAGDASDDGLRLAAQREPDVVLLDTAMADGVAAARRIAETMPQSRIVALAVPEREEELIQLVEAGVLGYVRREDSLADVVAATIGAVREQMVGSPRLRTLLVRRVRALAAELRPPVEASLTTRERQIIDLIARGFTNKAIASELQIEPATVKNHVHNILHKLGVSTRAAAVAEVRRAARRMPATADAQSRSAA